MELRRRTWPFKDTSSAPRRGKEADKSRRDDDLGLMCTLALGQMHNRACRTAVHVEQWSQRMAGARGSHKGDRFARTAQCSGAVASVVALVVAALTTSLDDKHSRG